MPSETPVSYAEIERDRYGLMYSGPHIGVGEVRQVYEAAPVDAERERMLDLIRDLWDASFPGRMGEAEQGHIYERTVALLREHGRLSGEEGA